MSNHLKDQSSPYLLQHAENPVDWYPWGKEAFEKAKNEDKPVFLSIGYSTCHWCHVMAHESFEDDEIADILNNNFVSIKVDKEERPDIDSIYMAVCQALTGNGGWPTSIFMTPDQKPFYAGTYYPKKRGYGTIGFEALLLTISEKWRKERDLILRSADEITAAVGKSDVFLKKSDSDILVDAVRLYKKSFDTKNGGFGHAPKFPTPHNLIFLLKQYQKYGDKELLDISEKTLTQMYRGGMFDHIGYGFSRYSTDRFFLVPHFEKMLYDNALLISAYCVAYEITKNQFFKEVAEKTAFFIMTEMTNKDGAFFSAQDADSEGVEGKYYVFEPEEIIGLLGEKDGNDFNEYFDITGKGNFEGKNIPNLLKTSSFTDRFDEFLPKIRSYRKERTKLHTDDKILTVWNSLMISALCSLYRISGKEEYLDSAKKAMDFINKELFIDNTLYVSFRDGKRGEKGFLDDYAAFAYALLSLYGATLETDYLDKAKEIVNKTISEFFDNEHGGFFLYGKENEALIFRPKETYDGAIPSGNSIMAYNLVQLYYLLPDENQKNILEKQLDALYGEAQKYPSGYAMFLISFSDYNNPYEEITVVIRNNEDIKSIPLKASLGSFIKILNNPTDEYKLLNDKTTYYICKNRSCFPPVNEINQ